MVMAHYDNRSLHTDRQHFHLDNQCHRFPYSLSHEPIFMCLFDYYQRDYYQRLILSLIPWSQITTCCRR